MTAMASDTPTRLGSWHAVPPLAERLTQKGLHTTITLADYLGLLEGTGSFVIPCYQRGYVWGQRDRSGALDSATHLARTLRDSLGKGNVFLQGITVHEVPGLTDLVLVDGQQRTTFLYLLLHYLGYTGYLSIRYDIREESNRFLAHLDAANTACDEDERYQDIYFFKRTLRILDRELRDYDRKELLQHVLTNVRFLFIAIPQSQARIVFSMMNGNKARMAEEELIKAELLRRASQRHQWIGEAEHSMLRGRLAREWDRWLYWWNRTDVKDFFRTDSRQLGWLLPLAMESAQVTFKGFRDKLLSNGSISEAKAVFRRLRLLQKRIEDKYCEAHSYNYLGIILYVRNTREQRLAFLRWYLSPADEEARTQGNDELKRYCDWCLLGMNHEDIKARRNDIYLECRDRFRSELASPLLYIQHYETAYRWLLRQNIKEDNRYKDRKFDFRIERDRSLEHVYPKALAGHHSEQGVPLSWDDKLLTPSQVQGIRLWREQMRWTPAKGAPTYSGTEHCIGNLVLLYGRDNSKFNKADFRQKNRYFFADQDDDAFRSRHLIHTTMVFSDIRWENPATGLPWNPEQVARRMKEELDVFDKELPEIKEDTHGTHE